MKYIKTLILLFSVCIFFAKSYAQEIPDENPINTDVDLSQTIEGSDINIASFSGCFWDSFDFKDCLDEVELKEGYQFYIDETTGDLMYGKPDGSASDAQRLSCVHFCPVLNAAGVIKAQSTIWSDDVSAEMPDFIKEAYSVSSTQTNLFLTAEAGKWLPKESYVYKTDVYNYSDGLPIYISGIFKDFTFFNWAYPSANNTNKWIQSSEVNLYSPNGIPLSDENALGINSVSKFGYGRNLPYAVASNATYNSILFEGFENYTTSTGLYACDCFDEMTLNLSAYFATVNPDPATTLNTENSHSGKQSLAIDMSGASTSGFPFRVAGMGELNILSYGTSTTRNISQQMLDKGISIKAWVKSSDENLKLMLYEPLGKYIKSAYPAFEKIARTGEWTLYEVKITSNDWTSLASSVISSGIAAELGLKILFQGDASAKVYLDDIRMQPLDAQMMAYVYDPETWRLVAQFDDQNFATFYQYNQEGQLTRNIIETERGAKTLAEKQYHIPTQKRD